MKLQVNKVKLMILTGLAVLALSAAGIIYYLSYPSSIIALDVNPSIELHTNRLGEVVSVDPVNEDAAKLMEGYQLTDRNLETVIQNIVDRMILNGYLVDENTNQILVTTDENVNSDDLMNKVNTTLSSYLQEKQLAVDVLNQKTEIDKEHVEEAHRNNVSVGKMAVINALILNDNTLSAADLAKDSIKELIQIVHSRNLNLGQLLKNYKESLKNQAVSASVTPAADQDNVAAAAAEDNTAAENHSLGANAIIISTGDDSEITEDAKESESEDTENEIEDQEKSVKIHEDQKASDQNKVNNGKHKSVKQHKEDQKDSDDNDGDQEVTADNKAGTDAVSGATVNVKKDHSSYDMNEDNDEEDSDLQEDADGVNEIRENDQDDRYFNDASEHNNNSQDNENEDDNSQGDEGEDD